MTGLTAFKLGAQICATLGVSKIVGDVIKNNVNIVTKFDLVQVCVGKAVLSALIVQQSTNMVDLGIDNAVVKIKEQLEKDKEKKKEKETLKNQEDETKEVDE